MTDLRLPPLPTQVHHAAVECSRKIEQTVLEPPGWETDASGQNLVPNKLLDPFDGSVDLSPAFLELTVVRVFCLQHLRSPKRVQDLKLPAVSVQMTSKTLDLRYQRFHLANEAVGLFHREDPVWE